MQTSRLALVIVGWIVDPPECIVSDPDHTFAYHSSQLQKDGKRLVAPRSQITKPCEWGHVRGAFTRMIVCDTDRFPDLGL
jgi:hypothetical protein